MTTRTKIVLGILGAAAAGVAIGLLIAPEKGSEMRSRIKKTTGGWVDNLSHLFHNGKEQMEEAGKTAKAKAEDKVNKLKESLG